MPVIRKDTEHDELKSMMGEIKTLIAEVRKEQIEAGKREVARKYLDDLVVIHEQDMNDNGKPGLRSVRTKVLNFETRLTGIGLLVAGDIILRVVQFFLEKS
jgi:hypothetical protein